jgi:acid phosphatase (class A)
VPEIRPGILQGYLAQEDYPNSLDLLPPPPAEGSAALALDLEVNAKARALHDTPRFDLAASDADLHFPHAAGFFACAVGAPINEQDTPSLYMLLRRSLTDAGLATYAAKDHYQRPRPFVVNGEPTCTPDEEETYRTDGSYPSGHTSIGWTWALILSELAPEHTDAILARGLAYGESRLVCNIHWHSDVVAGRIIAAATVARLHADPVFHADMCAARKELEAAWAEGLKPAVDCEAEAAVLAR